MPLLSFIPLLSVASGPIFLLFLIIVIFSLKSFYKALLGLDRLVYDHHKHEVVDKLLGIQHDYKDLIISSQHIHLDHDNCFEIVVVKGKMKKLIGLASKLKAIKGVKHASLTKCTLGKNI